MQLSGKIGVFSVTSFHKTQKYVCFFWVFFAVLPTDWQLKKKYKALFLFTRHFNYLVNNVYY